MHPKLRAVAADGHVVHTGAAVQVTWLGVWYEGTVIKIGPKRNLCKVGPLSLSHLSPVGCLSLTLSLSFFHRGLIVVYTLCRAVNIYHQEHAMKMAYAAEFIIV